MWSDLAASITPCQEKSILWSLWVANFSHYYSKALTVQILQITSLEKCFIIMDWIQVLRNKNIQPIQTLYRQKSTCPTFKKLLQWETKFRRIGRFNIGNFAKNGILTYNDFYFIWISFFAKLPILKRPILLNLVSKHIRCCRNVDSLKVNSNDV